MAQEKKLTALDTMPEARVYKFRFLRGHTIIADKDIAFKTASFANEDDGAMDAVLFEIERAVNNSGALRLHVSYVTTIGRKMND